MTPSQGTQTKTGDDIRKGCHCHRCASSVFSGNLVMLVQPHVIAQQWLQALADVASSDDDKLITTVKPLFAPDPWLRDLLVLSDDYHTAHGHEEILKYLSHESRLRSSQLGDFLLDTSASHGGAFVEKGPTGDLVVLFFTFSIQQPVPSYARGCARLQLHEGDWKAWTVLLVLHELMGYEEEGRDNGTGNIGKTWKTSFEERRAMVEQDPEVLIGT